MHHSPQAPRPQGLLSCWVPGILLPSPNSASQISHSPLQRLGLGKPPSFLPRPTWNMHPKDTLNCTEGEGVGTLDVEPLYCNSPA